MRRWDEDFHNLSPSPLEPPRQLTPILWFLGKLKLLLVHLGGQHLQWCVLCCLCSCCSRTLWDFVPACWGSIQLWGNVGCEQSWRGLQGGCVPFCWEPWVVCFHSCFLHRAAGGDMSFLWKRWVISQRA